MFILVSGPYIALGFNSDPAYTGDRRLSEYYLPISIKPKGNFKKLLNFFFDGQSPKCGEAFDLSTLFTFFSPYFTISIFLFPPLKYIKCLMGMCGMIND